MVFAVHPCKMTPSLTPCAMDGRLRLLRRLTVRLARLALHHLVVLHRRLGCALGEERALLVSLVGVFLAGVATSTLSFAVLDDGGPHHRRWVLAQDGSSDVAERRGCRSRPRMSEPRRRLLADVQACVAVHAGLRRAVEVEVHVAERAVHRVDVQGPAALRACVVEVLEQRRLPQEMTRWQWTFRSTHRPQ